MILLIIANNNSIIIRLIVIILPTTINQESQWKTQNVKQIVNISLICITVGIGVLKINQSPTLSILF